MSEMKVCTKCKIEKPTSDFYKESRGGFRSVCIPCYKAYLKSYRDENYDKLKQHAAEYRSANKEKISTRSKKYREKAGVALKEKKRDYYFKNHTRMKAERKEKHLKNKDTDNARSAEYRNKNRESIREKDREYYKNPIRQMKIRYYNHARRSRTLSSERTLTVRQWNKILDMQRNSCAICRRVFSESLPPTKDHIIPVSKGGGLTYGNTQALCHSCNCKKSATVNIATAMSTLLVEV